MSNTKDIKAEIAEVIIKNAYICNAPDCGCDLNEAEATQEILDKIGERIPDTNMLSKKKTSAEFREGHKYAVFQMKHGLGIK